VAKKGMTCSLDEFRRKPNAKEGKKQKKMRETTESKRHQEATYKGCHKGQSRNKRKEKPTKPKR
jgi:hypothetical protein